MRIFTNLKVRKQLNLFFIWDQGEGMQRNINEISNPVTFDNDMGGMFFNKPAFQVMDHRQICTQK